MIYESDGNYDHNNRKLHFTTPEVIVDQKNGPPGVHLSMYGQSKRDPYTKNGSSLAFKIDNSTTWSNETIGGVVFQTFETTLNSELRIKFGYH